MQSNSKLTHHQKNIFKIMRAESPDVDFATLGNTTIAFKPSGNLIEFSTAICAYNEKKFRRKVGKYIALRRLEAGESVKMIPYQFENMLKSNESEASGAWLW